MVGKGKSRGDGQNDDGRPMISLAYDRDSGRIERLRNISDIIAFDHEVRKVTSGFQLPIRLGSILRTPVSAWPNFGIDTTPGNKAELEKLANSYYLQDAEEGRAGKNANDALYRIKKELARGRLEDLATYVARIITELMLADENGEREFRVCDIASGAGRLSSAIAASLIGNEQNLLERVTFHLVDYRSRLGLAVENVEALGAKVVPHEMKDDEFLRSTNYKFDFVASISHLHRKPVLSTHLMDIHEVLKDNGIFVSGDRHSVLTQHPELVFDLLEVLGVEGNKLDYFRELFGPLMFENCPLYEDISDEDINSMNDHGNYWTNLATGISKERYRGDLRVRILGAFLSSKQLEEELHKASFETDVEKIKVAFPKARLPVRLPIKLKHGSDTAVVTAAIKR